MATIAVPGSNQRNRIIVMTQGIPPSSVGENGAGAVLGVPDAGVPTVGMSYVGVHNFGSTVLTPVSNFNPDPNLLQEFLKVQPKALGAVQIIIGVVTFMFGIVQMDSKPPLSAMSGILFMGSTFCIISGSVTVAAENKLNPCLVSASAGVNVFNSIVAGVTFILLSIDFSFQDINPYCTYSSWDQYDCLFLHRTFGISGVLLVLNVLQFFISICIAVFGCKVIRRIQPVVSVVAVAPNLPFPIHSNDQAEFYTNTNMNERPSPEAPPPYSPSSDKPEY
ncbi:membrane-spanning 4-domains subfamily A member 4A-like [Hoplias malabaricus]|uniref:membrane-spanning 4-domains subfamily A member 4A-like n=1 Tax=Hoplias malabaricus TaxID=27720 RepID=UPI003461963A